MKLIRRPAKPQHNPLLALKLSNPKYESWRTFLDGVYWDIGTTRGEGTGTGVRGQGSGDGDRDQGTEPRFRSPCWRQRGRAGGRNV